MTKQTEIKKSEHLQKCFASRKEAIQEAAKYAEKGIRAYVAIDGCKYVVKDKI